MNDVRTGRQTALEDSLRLIGLSVKEVSARASADIMANLGESFFAEGANTNPENFSSLAISDDTATFIFNVYHVASYAAGP